MREEHFRRKEALEHEMDRPLMLKQVHKGRGRPHTHGARGVRNRLLHKWTCEECSLWREGYASGHCVRNISGDTRQWKLAVFLHHGWRLHMCVCEGDTLWDTRIKVARTWRLESAMRNTAVPKFPWQAWLGTEIR